MKLLVWKATEFVSHLPMTFANLDRQRQLVQSSALGANILLYDWNFPRWLRSAAGFGTNLPGICQDQKQALICLQKNNLAQKPGTEGWNKEGKNNSQLIGSNKGNNATLEGCYPKHQKTHLHPCVCL